jgi:hypothetical protein
MSYYPGKEQYREYSFTCTLPAQIKDFLEPPFISRGLDSAHMNLEIAATDILTVEVVVQALFAVTVEGHKTIIAHQAPLNKSLPLRARLEVRFV